MPKRANIFLDRVAAANDLPTDEETRGEPQVIPIRDIDHNPQQSRQVFTNLDELAASIAQNGVIQPIGVRPVGGRYTIIYGERRFRAAQQVGLTAIPATVHEVSAGQAAVMTALENLQREDLDIEDEARYFQTLLDATGLSERKLADKLGIDRLYINRRLKLLRRPDLLERYRQGLLTLHEVAGLAESGSAGTTSPNEEAEPLERDEIESGSRGTTPSDETGSAGTTPFRWRPVQRSYAVLQRLKPENIPAADRETFKRMLDEIATEVERLRRDLA